MINKQTQHCDVQIMVAGLIITLFRIIPKLQCLGFTFRPISRFAVLCPYHIRSNIRTDLDVLRVTSTTSTALCTPRVLNKCTEALINLITIRKTSMAMHRETTRTSAQNYQLSRHSRAKVGRQSIAPCLSHCFRPTEIHNLAVRFLRSSRHYHDGRVSLQRLR